jgi:NAD-dependent dihydropyrimidine dehydrogenase PreA subunit
VCPQGLFELGKDKKPELVDELACNQCGVCANLCPTKAITVENAKQLRK